MRLLLPFVLAVLRSAHGAATPSTHALVQTIADAAKDIQTKKMDAKDKVQSSVHKTNNTGGGGGGGGGGHEGVASCTRIGLLSGFSAGQLGFELYTESANHLHLSCYAVGHPINDGNMSHLAIVQKTTTEFQRAQVGATMAPTSLGRSHAARYQTIPEPPPHTHAAINVTIHSIPKRVRTIRLMPSLELSRSLQVGVASMQPDPDAPYPCTDQDSWGQLNLVFRPRTLHRTPHPPWDPTPSMGPHTLDGVNAHCTHALSTL